MSKGSNRRPAQVPVKQVEDNWDTIFGKKKTFFFSINVDGVHDHFEEHEVRVAVDKTEKK